MKYIVVSLIVMLSGCVQSSSDAQGSRKPVYNVPVQKVEYRDSLLLTHTIKEWNQLNWYVFENYENMYLMKNSDVEVTVLRCFYDTSHTKIVAWVLMKMPNAKTIKIYNKDESSVNMMCPGGPDTVYRAKALIGMRSSNSEIWKVYPLDMLSVGCTGDTATIVRYMEDYYFDKMKEDNAFVVEQFLDSNYGGPVRDDLEEQAVKYGLSNFDDKGVVVKNYGYNLNDDEFWEKSLLWQKGSRLPGLYMFQTVGNVTPKSKNGERILPEIDIPSHITDLYSADSTNGAGK